VCVVLLLGASALALIVGWKTEIATAGAFLTFVLLVNRLPELIDGGDTAARLFLFYLLLVLPAGASAAPGGLRVWVHNIGVLAIAMQIMILYAVTGLSKAAGTEWYEGTALYYISQVESIALPSMRELAKEPLVTVTASYFTVLYEVFFAFAMLSPLRLPWIVLGIAFHVGIGATLGLISFQIVMVGLDLFFVTDDEYARLGAWASSLRGRVAPALELVRGKLRKEDGAAAG